jgi:DNA-binding LacI/PurR family transcriptional regulator
MAKSKPTLRDVAQYAGCSITTTSNILQGRHNLYRAETVERVLSAAQALGYRANHIARSLATQRTATIGFILDPNHSRLTHNDYAQHVLDGVLAYLEGCDYDVRLISPRTSQLERLWNRIDNGTIDGAILLAPVMGSPLLEWHRHSRLPVVVAGSTLPESYALTTVDIDNEGAMATLTEWVLQQGHRAIGFVKGHPLHWSALQRERAFRQTLAQWNVPVREEWILQGSYTIESGRRAAEQLLRQASLPSVVICADDASAAGFIQRCTELGVRIPEDLSVAGFDDEPLTHPLVPFLTTVRHDKYQVGYLAAQLLLGQIETGNTAPQRLLLPGTPVIRRSVLPAPALIGSAPPQSTEGGSKP